MKKQSRKATHEIKPKENTPKPRWRQSLWLSVWTAVFSVGLYLFFLLLTHPEMIRFGQMPVFFAERRFFLEQLQIPGGFIDYLAAYLTDLFQTGWLGAVILTGLVIVTFFLFKKVLRADRWWITPLLPILLILLMQCRYDYAVSKMPSLMLSKMLSLMLALEGFLIYRDAFPAKSRFRFGLAIPFLFLIYLLSPGAMLLWIVLSVLYEIVNKSESIQMRILLCLGYLIAGFLIPRIAAGYLFLVPLKDAYFHHVLFLQSGKIEIIGVVLTGLIAILAVYFFLRKQEDQKTFSTTIDFIQGGVGLVILSLILGAAFLSTKYERQVLKVRYDAHEGRWNDLLKQVNAKTVDNSLCLFHFNRAIFHTGKMAYEFFNIPQRFGRYGLFLHKDLAMYNPLDLSDLYFEMGHIVEAERWASEALTLYGETSEVLKRLALINILKEEYPSAFKFLNRLKQNPNSRSWADHYLACLAEPSKMRPETMLQRLHAVMPKRDFIVVTDHPEVDLAKMLVQAPNNRMAFEYMMMDFLLRRDLNGFIASLKQYSQFVQVPLPRCYEEALIAYLTLKKTDADSAATQIDIRRSTYDRLKKFESILAKYGGNSDAAYDELSLTYANTYWYYLLYAKPVS